MRKNLQKTEIGIILFYKNFLSVPLNLIFKGGCRYNPTCSEYGVEAIKKYGPFKGLRISFVRFLSCNPLSRHEKEYPLI